MDDMDDSNRVLMDAEIVAQANAPGHRAPIDPEEEAASEARIEDEERQFRFEAEVKQEEEKADDAQDNRWQVEEGKTKGIFLSSVKLSQLHIMKDVQHGGARARFIISGEVERSIRENGWCDQAGSIKIAERHTDWQALRDKGILTDKDNPRQWFNDPDDPLFEPGDIADVSEDAYFEYRSFWVCDGNHRISVCQALVKARQVSDQRVLDPCIKHNV
jgi:hypothetical protein